jgi:SAM-dependent methyltransferase
VEPDLLDPCRYPRLPPERLENARVLTDRYDLLRHLPKQAAFAEIGVGLGNFSQHVLDICAPHHFHAIDTFDLHKQPTLWGKPTAELFGGQTHEVYYRGRFASALAANRMTVTKGDSGDVLRSLAPGSLDIVYLDADHRYGPVKRDLLAIRRVVRPDGWIVLNDYVPLEIGGSNMPYGVIQAAHEFMVEADYEMIYLALGWAMFCDVAIRRIGVGRSLRSVAEENAALRASLAAMNQSLSWRITAPLRALGRRAKRG